MHLKQIYIYMYIYIYIRDPLRNSHGLLECSAPVLCLYVCMYACMHARVILFVYALKARVPRRNSLDTYLVVTYTFLCTRVHTYLIAMCIFVLTRISTRI